MSGSTSSFGTDVVGGSTVLADRSCGTCTTCRAGAALSCPSPVATPRVTSRPVPTEWSAEQVADLRAAVLGVAALLEAPVERTALVLAEPGARVAVLAERLLGEAVVVSPSLRDPDLRARLADREGSGRAPVVLAGDDVRSAVRAVRRGGHVCALADATSLPSVTELVQREVTLLAPRQVAGVLDRLGDDDWAAVVAAA